MKNGIYLLLIILILSGVSCDVKNETVIAIDDIKITKTEFEEAFNMSRFASMEKGREVFLDSYIDKKLILKEAENMGLDKEPEFLSDIQVFWEKALLKSVLSKKSDELAALVDISDRKVRRYYEKNTEKLFAGRELAEVYEQIKWFIIQEEQSNAMEEWSKSLKKKAKIKVNYSRLGIEE